MDMEGEGKEGYEVVKRKVDVLDVRVSQSLSFISLAMSLSRG